MRLPEHLLPCRLRWMAQYASFCLFVCLFLKFANRLHRHHSRDQKLACRAPVLTPPAKLPEYVWILQPYSGACSVCPPTTLSRQKAFLMVRTVSSSTLNSRHQAKCRTGCLMLTHVVFIINVRTTRGCRLGLRLPSLGLSLLPLLGCPWTSSP